MKKFISIIVTLGILAWCPFLFAASCGQTLIGLGPNAQMLTFVCTAATGTFTATATNTANSTAIKGYYVSDIYTSPGGGATAPTDGSAVTLSTDDSPVWDILGGIGVVSATVTKRFVPPVTLPSGALAGATIKGPLTIAITGNSVASAVVTVRIFLWNN